MTLLNTIDSLAAKHYFRENPLSLKWACVKALKNHLCVQPKELLPAEKQIQCSIVNQYETEEISFNNLHPAILVYFPGWIRKLTFIINPTHLFNELYPRNFSKDTDIQEIIEYWRDPHFFTPYLNTIRDCPFCLQDPWSVCSKHSKVNCQAAKLLKGEYVLSPLETIEKIQELFPALFPQDSEVIEIVSVNEKTGEEEIEKTVAKRANIIQEFLGHTIEKLSPTEWKQIDPPKYCKNCTQVRNWYCDVHATLIQFQQDNSDKDLTFYRDKRFD